MSLAWSTDERRATLPFGKPLGRGQHKSLTKLGRVFPETSMSSLSRNAQVLRYLLEVAPGIGHTKLAKYAYLADLEARKYLGRPISSFRYCFDRHGPFDARGFFVAKDELLDGCYITESQVPLGPYVGFEMYPTERSVEYEFDLPDVQLLKYIADTYLSKSVRDLCDEVVYKTEPMLHARQGSALPMSRVNRKPGSRHDFDLERMLAGEASTQAGRVRPVAEVLNELRARHN